MWRMECADDHEGIFSLADVVEIGRTKEKVKIFALGKIVHVFFTHLGNGLILAIVLFAILVKLANLPIFDHQGAFLACIVEEFV